MTLRFKRTYVPYSLHLTDVRFDKYIGTQTASNYSSDVRLVAFDGSVDRKVHIWMNNPLRYDGKTFYQSSVNQGEDGIEQTGLQVVTNTGWMIPYVACMVVGIGMFFQFTLALLRFQNRRNRRKISPPAADPPPKAPTVAELASAEGTSSDPPADHAADDTGSSAEHRPTGLEPPAMVSAAALPVPTCAGAGPGRLDRQPRPPSTFGR